MGAVKGCHDAHIPGYQQKPDFCPHSTLSLVEYSCRSQVQLGAFDSYTHCSSWNCEYSASSEPFGYCRGQSMHSGGDSWMLLDVAGTQRTGDSFRSQHPHF